MPDNWGFVLAAYGLAAVVLTGYWRMLVRRERDLEDRAGERSHAAPISGHPRSKPGSRTSIQ